MFDYFNIGDIVKMKTEEIRKALADLMDMADIGSDDDDKRKWLTELCDEVERRTIQLKMISDQYAKQLEAERKRADGLREALDSALMYQGEHMEGWLYEKCRIALGDSE